MERIMNLANRAANSNAVINTLLVTTFGVLALRSEFQQRQIDALEAEKESLVKSNKAVTKTIWDSKQKLYADAEANSQKALVPLSKLKAIYGEVVTPASPALSASDSKQDGKPAKKFMI